MTLCASPETLQRLLRGHLDKADACVLRAHLAECATCRLHLDGLSDQPELRELLQSYSAASHLPTIDMLDVQRCLARLKGSSWRNAETPPTSHAANGGGYSFLAPPQDPDELGTLGPYRILAELGHGGMGVVFKAVEPALHRLVAVKVLWPERLDARSRVRFAREARAAAAVQHDHIVPVYAVADADEVVPYLVMQFVPGRTLRERIREERRLPARAAAEIVFQIAGALEAAHRAGLVHRDVKPANILLDEAQGRAKITDFGLVHVLEEDASTVEGGIRGTPEYMSPEQIRTPERIDGRSDVYSLGVTLYEALTGDVPFRGVVHLVLEKIQREEPVPPRRLNDQVPRDLQTICLKAMAKEPERRYASASAFADDLGRFLSGRPVAARPAGALERGWRWCRRRPGIAGLSAALVVAVLAGFVAVLGQWHRAEEEHQLAETRFRDALEAVNQLHTLVSKSPLLQDPKLQPLRKELLASARAYYARFAQTPARTPAMQAELARALFRLGTITLDIEAPEDALKPLQAAADIQEELLQAHSSDIVLQADLAHTLNNLANACVESLHIDESIDIRFRSLALSERLVRERPADPAGYLGLYRTHHNLGLIYHGCSLTAQAGEAYEKSMAAARRLVEAHPGDPQYGFREPATGLYLAQLHREEGRLEAAAKLLEKLAPLVRGGPRAAPFETLEATHITDAAVARVLSAQSAAPAHDLGKHWVEAETQLQQAVVRLRRLAAENPANTDLAVTLTIPLLWAGRLNQALGRTGPAEEFYREALAIADKLTHAYPGGLSFHASRLAAQFHLAGLCLDAGRLQEALALGDQVRKKCGHRHVYFGYMLRQCLVQRALSRYAAARYDDALADWDDLRADDAGKFLWRLPAFAKRFDWDQVRAHVAGRYRHIWEASRKLTEARRDAQDAAPLLRPLAEQVWKETQAYERIELLTGGICWWFAQMHATCARAVTDDAQAASHSGTDLAERHASRAVALLERARLAGYFRPDQRADDLRSGPEFAGLRGRADFNRLVTSLSN